MGPGTGDDNSTGNAGDGSPSDATDEEEEEWRFSVDDFPDSDGSVGEDSTSAGGDDESNVAGTLERRQPLEPGDIDLENALFVALGIFLVLGLIVGAMLGL